MSSTYLQLPLPMFLAAFPRFAQLLAPALPALLSDSRYVVRYRADPEAFEIGYASDKWHIN